MLTITEGLAEIKTLEKRIAKKREFCLSHLCRQDGLKDPLEKEGGTVAAIEREQQAINDLEKRIVLIRLAIARANQGTSVEINGTAASIDSWLVWRREIAPKQKEYLNKVVAHLNAYRGEAQKRQVSLVEVGKQTNPSDLVVHIKEKELSEAIELLEKTLGQLDGALSLKNATTNINV